MSRDAFDRLRDADPLRGHPAPDAASPQARAMQDAILAGEVTDIASGRRRRRIAAVIAVAAAIATAAALAVSTSRVSDPTSIGCYDGPATDASTLVLQARGPNPVAQCRELWEQGQVDPDVTSPTQVPDLVACVLQSGGHVGVFPAPSCDDVRTTGSTGVEGPVEGSSPTATAPGTTASPRSPVDDDPTVGLDVPDYKVEDGAVVAALEQVRLTLMDHCLTIDEATTFIHETLAEHGLQGWTVEPVMDGPYGDHCAAFFPQAPDREVLLIPEEPISDAPTNG